MARAGRLSGEEGADRLDWHRRLCKAQRARLAHRLGMMERRILEARRDAMEDWDSQNMLRAGGKKPGLDFYDRRPW